MTDDVVRVRARAAEQYVSWMWDDKVGLAARRYLLDLRGIAADVARSAGIGFIPGTGGRPGLTRHLAPILSQITEDAELVKRAGVMRPMRGRGPRSERLADYPLGGGYLVFPVRDAEGTVIGFKYRSVPEAAHPDATRYLGTAGSTGGAMFGLHTLKPDQREVYVFEGEIDWLSHATARQLYPHLLPAVAWYGHELTVERLAIVQQRFDAVHIAFDSDYGGWEGTYRAGLALAKAQLPYDLVPLPVGSDPNAILVSGGASRLCSYFEEKNRESLLEAQARLFANAGYTASDPLWAARSLIHTATATCALLTPQAVARSSRIAGFPEPLLSASIPRIPIPQSRATHKPQIAHPECEYPGTAI